MCPVLFFWGIWSDRIFTILFYFWYHTQQGRERRGLLPAVAKFALGKPEYEAGSEKRHTGRTTDRGRDQGKPRPEDHLSLLEAFLSPQNKCYLLYSGYQGALPEDGPVYMPRIIAAGYAELPPNTRLAGPERLAWGQDPYDRAHLPEIGEFDSIIPLRPVIRKE
ncbi:MAG: hypothetical protein GY807_19900 [Gammaproteobacteria bacterium]|nr:hypothetical protein [Gammaproteobacteria bacterium]